MTTSISPAAADFLRTGFESLLELEVLLRLRRRLLEWHRADALATEIGMAAADAERVLENLGARNFVDVRIGITLAYRYAPLDPGVHALLEEVAGIYHAHQEIVAALCRQSRPQARPADRGGP